MLALLARVLTVLTVALGLAVMAVSVYAAKVEAQDPEPVQGSPELLPGEPILQVGSPGDTAGPNDGVDGGALPEASDDWTAQDWVAPAPAVRYAAPDWAVPVVPTRRGSDNLSIGGRVWRVLSIKPGPASAGLNAWGGLDIPPDQLAVMQQVSVVTSVPWQIFAAIPKVESDFGRNMATSPAGAIGYGQFLPEMWYVFGNGGNPYDFHDALPAMGRYLMHAGALDDMAGAIYAYNHSWEYVAQVLSLATTYGYGGFGTGQAVGAGSGLIWPATGPISSYFGPDHPLGIDIDQTATPGAPVLAAHDGVVLFVGGDACCSYGHYVIRISPGALVTLYAHLDVLAVAAGDTVQQGQPLGTAGCTGHCTGAHLHFEVIENGIRQNPLDYLPAPGP